MATPAKYAHAGTLKICFDNLDKHQIKIKHFKADSASYQKEVVELVSQRATHFYVRITDFAGSHKQCGMIEKWEEVEINHHKKSLASTMYKPIKGEKEYRTFVIRVEKSTKQIDIESQTAYDYFGIMTDNLTLTDKEDIEFYNQTSDSENLNRYLLNDFNLPFPDMDKNTVYRYLMALCSILFGWIKTVLVKNKTENITLKMRVKAICFHYIAVATNFVYHALQKIIQVFSSQQYQILKI